SHRRRRVADTLALHEVVKVRDHHEPVACGDPKHSRGRRAAILVDEVIAKNPELKFYEAEIAAARGGAAHACAWGGPPSGAPSGAERACATSVEPTGETGRSGGYRFPRRFNFRGVRVSERRSRPGRSTWRSSGTSSFELRSPCGRARLAISCLRPN